jgi:hypothetical protein
MRRGLTTVEETLLSLSQLAVGIKTSRNGGAPPAIVKQIVAEMLTLGLGIVRDTTRCPRKGAHRVILEKYARIRRKLVSLPTIT